MHLFRQGPAALHGFERFRHPYQAAWPWLATILTISEPFTTIFILYVLRPDSPALVLDSSFAVRLAVDPFMPLLLCACSSNDFIA